MQAGLDQPPVRSSADLEPRAGLSAVQLAVAQRPCHGDKPRVGNLSDIPVHAPKNRYARERTVAQVFPGVSRTPMDAQTRGSVRSRTASSPRTCAPWLTSPAARQNCVSKLGSRRTF